MAIGFNTIALQSLFKCNGSGLAVVMRDDHRANHESAVLELPPESEYILIVCNAKIGAFFVFLNISGTNHNHYLYAVTEFLKHSQLAVGLKSRQHTASMMVVKEFST